MKKILQKESPVLRQISEEVDVKSITTPKVQKILLEMKEALDSQDDGVAIAAPQIGYNLRIFLVSRKVEAIIKNEENQKADSESVNMKHKDIVFINPIIKKISKEKKSVEEGCLSVRYLYGQVLRSKKATVEAYDENGKKFVKPGTGLLAQIFQHEIDHLNGVLFIDKAKNLEDLPPESLKEKNDKRN
jgi:peptide deformylase